MKIAISVESTNDLSVELLQKNDIKVLPFHVVLGDKHYRDGEVSVQQIFDFVDSTGILPKTTAINEFEYTEYFEQLRKENDAVIHICLSSGLSSSCGNAQRASKNLSNVFVIDSLSLSTGIGLLALYACKLVNEGYLASDIAQKVQERVDKVQASFVIERLDYLYKGGRCNALSLLGANLLRIRPRIVVSDGKMGSDKKYRGAMGKVVKKYCEEVLQDFDTPDLDTAFITYSSATPEMVENARNALIARGFKNIYETHAGCTITSHCGANTIGILYFNDGEKEE